MNNAVPSSDDGLQMYVHFQMNKDSELNVKFKYDDLEMCNYMKSADVEISENLT